MVHHAADGNVLQCVAVCCSVLQCAAVCCSVSQCIAVCCSVFQCVAVCCNVQLYGPQILDIEFLSPQCGALRGCIGDADAIPFFAVVGFWRQYFLCFRLLPNTQTSGTQHNAEVSRRDTHMSPITTPLCSTFLAAHSLMLIWMGGRGGGGGLKRGGV